MDKPITTSPGVAATMWLLNCMPISPALTLNGTITFQIPVKVTFRPCGCHRQTGRLRRGKFVGEMTSAWAIELDLLQESPNTHKLHRYAIPFDGQKCAAGGWHPSDSPRPICTKLRLTPA